MTVNATQPLRTVDTRLSGVNLTYWQHELNTPAMRQLVKDAGLGLFRLPGGSGADSFHFTSPPPYGSYNTIPVIANFIESVGGDGMVTIDYGSGSPQEGAALLAYLNAPVGSTVNIGAGDTWDATANAWVSKDWKTAGYWASLRASKPLATDDGLNFLRVNHAAAWNFSYFEIGNEEFATWETDHHSATGKGGTNPAGYTTFAKQFDDIAQQIDPGIKTGIVVSPPLKYNMVVPTWTSDALTQAAALGFVPGFLSDHKYMTNLSDQNLLLHSINDPAYKQDNYLSSWKNLASYYRTLLTQKLGSAGAGTQLMETEYNSDINTKQSSNLVGGLWEADAIGGLMQTEFTAAIHWDLTNGYAPLTTPDTTHYGWRQGVDEGIISTGNGPGPASGSYVPYPTYFAQQLASKLTLAGSAVLPVTTNDPNLSVYSVKLTDGHVRLMVINKSATSAITGSFAFNGFTPGISATQWQYGVAEDNAQSLTTDGHASLTQTTIVSGVNASGLTQSFPAYSMSVIDLPPANGRPKVTIGDATITEGNTGTQTLSFPVTFDIASTTPVDVAYSTANGTASAGSDYVAASGTLHFAPGQTSAVIQVVINGDTDFENDETFTVNIVPGSNADVAKGQAVGTIKNDDISSLDPASVTLEAELALLSGGTTVQSSAGGFSGTGYADYAGQNSAVEWTTSRKNLGRTSLVFRYANGATSARPLTIYVNGSAVGTISCAPTGSWLTWTTASVNADLTPGVNSIMAVASTGSGGANVDNLTINSQIPAWLSPASNAVYTWAGNTLTLSAGAVTVLADPATTDPGTYILASGSSTVLFQTSQHLAGLTLSNSATATMAAGGGKVLRTNVLTVGPSATLDLNDNDLIYDYTGTTPLASVVRGLIGAGRAGGAWTGTGLRSTAAKTRADSSTTLGFMEATDYKSIYGASATFDGETLDNTAVVVKYTLYGDTNFDGKVDFNDFLRMQSGYGSANTSFTQGDFDNDGSTTFNDFLMLQGQFGKAL